MATRTWLDQNGNWTNTSNWSGGSAPANDDIIRIFDGNKTLDTNMTTSITGTTLIVGPNFAGKIGTAGAPLVLSTGTTVEFFGERTQQCYFNLTGGTVRIHATSANPNAFHLIGGTATSLSIRSGMLVIGGSATVTAGYILGPSAQVSVESGATLTAISQYGGTVNCEAAAGTVNQFAGTWNHVGDTTFNITALNISGPQARFNWQSTGGTVTAVTVNHGYFDGSNLDAGTITNGTVYTGGTIDIDNSMDTIVTSNAIVVRGGRYIKGPSATESVEVPEFV